MVRVARWGTTTAWPAAGGRSLVRFAFCKRAEVLDEAIDRLIRAFTA